MVKPTDLVVWLSGIDKDTADAVVKGLSDIILQVLGRNEDVNK